MNYTAMRALIRNDLRLYLTDRRAVVIGVLVPVLIAAFFGYVFGGNGKSDAAGKLPIALVDEDHSAVSSAIATDMAHDPLFAVQVLSRTPATAQVRAGKVQVAVIMPSGFGAGAADALLHTASKPEVELLIDPSQALSGRVVEGSFAQYGMQEIARAAFSTAASPIQGPGHGPSFPFTVKTSTVTSARDVPYNGYAHSFAGMTIQFILFAGIDAGVLLLMSRERGIWQRIRSAPLTKGEFLLARTLATSAIGLFQFTLIYAAAYVVFGVRIAGSFLGFVAIALAFCVLNATFGLMLAALGRSAAATRGIATMVTLLLVMLGGAWVPAFVFPRWLQQASLAAPTRWAVDGLDAVTWRGLGLSAAMPSVLVLGCSAIACLAIAIWRFRWEE